MGRQGSKECFKVRRNENRILDIPMKTYPVAVAEGTKLPTALFGNMPNNALFFEEKNVYLHRREINLFFINIFLLIAVRHEPQIEQHNPQQLLRQGNSITK